MTRQKDVGTPVYRQVKWNGKGVEKKTWKPRLLDEASCPPSLWRTFQRQARSGRPKQPNPNL